MLAISPAGGMSEGLSTATSRPDVSTTRRSSRVTTRQRPLMTQVPSEFRTSGKRSSPDILAISGAILPGGAKKVAAEKAHLVLIDETGLFLNPLVRRSWSPVGQTPVIGGDGGHRTKVSVIGAVSVSPVGQRLGAFLEGHVARHLEEYGPRPAAAQ